MNNLKSILQSLLIFVLAILLLAVAIGYRQIVLGCQPGTVCVQVADPIQP